MEKKGQFTLFLIVGVVIVVMVVLIVFLRSDIIKSVREVQKKVTLPPEVQEIERYVDSCVESSTRNALFITALQGGYYEAPQNSLEYNYEELKLSSFIPYYLIDNQKTVPTKEEISKELSRGVEAELKECINFSTFEQDIAYSWGELSTESELGKESVGIEVKLPLKIKMGDSEFMINDFKSNVKTEYLSFYNTALELTEEQEKHPRSMCITCIPVIAENNNVNISTTEMMEGSSYIIIYYMTKGIEEPAKVYSFAHKFSLEQT
ncbi:MAG: hypothetical protein QW404_01115 [Candidatus Nanoarchaeia archaeon]